MADQPVWLTFIVAFIVMNVLLVGMAYMTYYERKVLAAMQDRMGPTRTGPKGLLQPIADGIKLLGKEDLIPAAADKWVFFFAPLVVFVTAIVGVAVIPFGRPDPGLRPTISTVRDRCQCRRAVHPRV